MFSGSRKKGQAGMTLLEVVIAVVIFSLMIGVTLELIHVSSSSFTDKFARSNIEVKGERTLKLIVESIHEGTQLNVAPGNFSFTFKVPVDSDNDGNILSGYKGWADDAQLAAANEPAAGILEYGANVDGNIFPDEDVLFSYVAESRLVEADLQVDLNFDGDMNDSFDLGYIQRSTNIPGDTPVQIGVSNIVQRTGNYGASITDDANADTTGRIFEQINASMLQINIWVMTVSSDQRPYLVRCNQQVMLRNQDL